LDDKSGILLFLSCLFNEAFLVSGCSTCCATAMLCLFLEYFLSVYVYI